MLSRISRLLLFLKGGNINKVRKREDTCCKKEGDTIKGPERWRGGTAGRQKERLDQPEKKGLNYLNPIFEKKRLRW